MKHAMSTVVLIFTVGILLAACLPSATVPIPRNALDVAPAATETPLAIDATPQPLSERICLVRVQRLNVRSGPDVEFPRVATLAENAQVVPSGSNSAQTWYFGTFNGIDGWVASEYVDCYPDLESLPTTQIVSDNDLATPVPEVAATPSPASVTLVEPLEGTLCGRRTFRWQGTADLAPDQMYELVFWPVGGDPMVDGRGPVGVQQTSEVVVDLSAAADNSYLLMNGRDYEWGVLLVTSEPYSRVQYLGGGHPFRLRALAECDADGTGAWPITTRQASQPEYPDD